MTRDEEKYFASIGKKLRELRIKAGYSSQEGFAYAADIPRAQYARYEKGVNVTLLSFRKILRFHKLSHSDFFKGID